MSVSRASARVSKLSDLADRSAVEAVLKAYYERDDVRLADDDGHSKLEQYFGNNDFYNSEIRKISIKVGKSEGELHEAY